MNDDYHKLIEFQKKAYTEHYEAHPDSPVGVMWNDRETQFLRFDRLLNACMPKSGQTLLDVGCGDGALRTYLDATSRSLQYHGIDVVEAMLEWAAKNYADATLYQGDFLGYEFESPDRFDYVTCSGMLNLKGEVSSAQWEEYSYDVIARMYELCEKGISFNVLTAYSTFRDETLAYFDPRLVFDWCHSNLSRFIKVDHQYPLYEMTVSVMREESIKEDYDQNIYGKYFTGP